MPAQDARESARPNTHTRNMPNRDQTLSVLRSLSRGGALAIESNSEAGIEIITTSPRSGGPGANRLQVAAGLWQAIIELGWVVPHETLEGWRISNAGRIALKRMLSRDGAPDWEPEAGTGADGRPSRSDRTTTARAARGTTGETPKQNENESPLAWLRQRRDRQGRSYINEAQFTAGERLRRDFTYGSMMPSVTANWSAVGGGASAGAAPDRELELRDSQLRARNRFRAALAAVGPEFASVLVDVCCYLLGLEEVEAKSGWPRRTAKVVLLLALSALARFYGIEERRGAGNPSDNSASRPSPPSP